MSAVSKVLHYLGRVNGWTRCGLTDNPAERNVSYRREIVTCCNCLRSLRAQEKVK